MQSQLERPSRRPDRCLTHVLAATALAAASAAPAVAQDFEAESHFSGETVTIVVASGAGSATDLNARQIASILGNNIPGNPTVVVANQPGGGGVTGLNSFWNTADAEGYTLFFQGGTAFRQILADMVGAEADLNEMPALGGIGGGAVAYGSASRISGPADLHRNEGDGLFVGLRGLSSAPTFDMLARLAALETSFTGVQYPGGAAEARLAVFRGEADIFSENEPAFDQQIIPEIEAGTVVPLWQTGLLIDGELVRDPQTPDVPTFNEVWAELDAGSLDGVLAEAMEIADLANTVFFSIYAAPNTPDEIVDVLGEAVWDTLNDPAFLETTEVNDAPSHIVDAATATDANRRIIAMSPELKEAYLEWWQVAGLDL
jgi:tripartite-type tricarboxylate transporter receptor subunit TctC